MRKSKEMIWEITLARDCEKGNGTSLKYCVQTFVRAHV